MCTHLKTWRTLKVYRTELSLLWAGLSKEFLWFALKLLFWFIHCSERVNSHISRLMLMFSQYFSSFQFISRQDRKTMCRTSLNLPKRWFTIFKARNPEFWKEEWSLDRLWNDFLEVLSHHWKTKRAIAACHLLPESSNFPILAD